MTASNIKRLSLAAVRLQANQKAPEKRPVQAARLCSS
jgi:hypothetical protein